MFISDLGPKIGHRQNPSFAEERKPLNEGLVSNEDLVQALKDNDHSVRVEAAVRLTESDNAQIVDLLIDLLVNGNNTTARCFAALVLGKKGDTRAIKPLTLVLKSRNPELYQYSASALSNLLADREADPVDVQSAVEELILGLEDTEKKVWQSSAIVLGELEKEEAVESLIECLSDNNYSVYSCARELLTGFQSDKTVKLLVDYLNSDESPETKSRAIYVLGEIGAFDKNLIDPYSVEDLFVKYIEDKNENKIIRLSSIEALGKIRSNKAVSQIIDLLELKDQAFSRFGIEALGRIKDPKAVGYMAKLLESNDPNFSVDSEDRHEVAWYSACALSHMKPSDSAEPLTKALLNKDPVVKLYALEVLNTIDLPAGININPIVDCLNSENPRVKIEAIKLLGRIRDTNAVKHLVKCLDDYILEVRVCTVIALGNIRDPEAVDPLIECLTDNIPEVRARAAMALGNIGNPKAIEPLVKCLDTNENKDVCSYIATALIRINDPSVPEHLISSLFKHNNPEVRSYLTHLLADWIGEDIVPPLLAGLCYGDERIIYHSQEAMNRLYPLLLIRGLINCTEEPYDETMRKKAELLLSEIKEPECA